MDGMSDIRNEIEQRLGVFARPGAKDTFADATVFASFLRLLDYAGTAIAKNDHVAAQNWYSQATKMITAHPDLNRAGSSTRNRWLDIGERIKKARQHSRPGAKATMGKYWVEYQKGKHKYPVGSMQDGLDRVKNSADGVLKYADHGMTSVLAYGVGRDGFTGKGIGVILTEDGKLHQKHASARDGAKATFAFPGIVVKEDAQYIYYYPDEDDRATFADEDGKGAYTVKSNRTGKPVSAKTYRSWDEAVSASNAINEKLPPLKKRKGFARTGAKAAFGAVSVNTSASSADLLKEAKRLQDKIKTSGSDFDKSLLEMVTNELEKRGMSLHSRPGAKTAMGKAADALNYIRNSIANGKTVYVTAGSRTTKVTPQTYAKWEASGRPLFKLGGDGALLMASGSSYVRLTMGDDMMLAGVTAMSRPGEKATAAKTNDKTECADCETEQDKAGLKLMEKADKAVSDKIRTLIKEGKPQDQAVAIALDMKRRGEL